MLISIQTAVVLSPVSLVILIRSQEPYLSFLPARLPASHMLLLSLYLAEVTEVSWLSNCMGRWWALLPHVAGKASRQDLLEGSWGPINLDSFSLSSLLWATMHHAPCFSPY